ncbi:fimbrial protein [Leclercia adecarboxylata]|uniref:fimbrial protein n=1 Tax=Leclercia adecarboxylata TaxID=83655 RepID=UPI00202AA29A|nr:fimbrial protein [Leclercia adecarboxylata]URN97855.1 fimbrial protein [Leclercia adecarboxylata]
MKYANKIFTKTSGVLLILCGCFSFSASATCQFMGGAGTQTISFTPSNVIVQRDAPVGSVIYSSSSPGSGDFLVCDGSTNTNYYQMVYLGGVPTSIDHAYETNIPGVAISVNLMWGYLDNPASTDNTGSGTVSSPPIKYKLYKTGDIQSGQLKVGELGNWTVSGITALKVNLIGGAVTEVACAITTPNLTFPIGAVSKADFGNTIGFTPDKTSTQSLGLDCDKNANINVTLNGQQNPDVSDASVLALNNQGDANTAQGVGVQLLYDGNPLVINNQLQLKQSSGGKETFPITARYYQTRNSVTVGEANTSATLTLTYQ